MHFKIGVSQQNTLIGGKKMNGMDEEMLKKDIVELINTFINRSINKTDLLDYPRRIEKRRLENVSFLITRSKSSSWAEDLADLGSIEEKDRAFN